MDRFTTAQRNIIGNNRFIISSGRQISQPSQISEDATAQPLFMTQDMWTRDSSTQMQAFHTTNNENPVLNSQEAWNETYGSCTIHPASTLITVELNQAVEASREIADMSTSLVSSMEPRNLREEMFHRRLHIWIEKLEDRFVRDVCGWALRYVPEKPIFGLVTDFSRAKIMLVYHKSRWMKKADLEAFKETLIALRMWAYGCGIEMEPMSPQTAGGSSTQGICNLATICVTPGARPLPCLVTERRTLLTEIMELTMERRAGSMKMRVSAMIFNMLEDVLPKWKYDIDMRKQKKRARVINQFIREPTF